MPGKSGSIRRLEEQIEINSSPDAVWGVLRDFGQVARWAPHVLTSKSVDGQATGLGSRRVFQHLWGFRLEEVITRWDEGLGYSFDIVTAPFVFRDVRETWTVHAALAGARVLTSVEYDVHFGALGSALDRVLLRRLIRREMQVGLAGLKKYVESNGTAR